MNIRIYKGRANEIFRRDANAGINKIKNFARDLFQGSYIFHLAIGKIDEWRDGNWHDRSTLFKREMIITALRGQVDTHQIDRTILSHRPPIGLRPLPPSLSSLPLIRAANWFNWFCIRYVIIDACKRECGRGSASRHIKIQRSNRVAGQWRTVPRDTVVVHPEAATAGS